MRGEIVIKQPDTLSATATLSMAGLDPAIHGGRIPLVAGGKM
jgi:hypothetical protein